MFDATPGSTFVYDYAAKIENDLPTVLANIVNEYLFEIVDQTDSAVCTVYMRMFGQITGTHTVYYHTGKPKLQCTFEDGMRHGNVTGWEANGKLSYYGSYYRGALHGVLNQLVLYHENRWWIREHFVHGNRNGKTEWRKTRNGFVSHSAMYVDNKLHGETVMRYPTGIRSAQQTYSHGVLCGMTRRWDPLGNLLSERDYGPPWKCFVSNFLRDIFCIKKSSYKK